ncbi:hypothetical protein [Sphingobacterium sp. SYP-B4668]|uniref:hypothetical protein n=1 Tax=Sphingobacterium sp. SYP-B4668 TaxID=2996035 RepID=UPI0022DD5A69|nr:hypothetical protein [Sphingobacterium sp. SYP-B4668]
MKVGRDTMEYARFYIGNDKDAALTSFVRCSGEANTISLGMLRLDLIERNQDKDVLLAHKVCTLKQLEHNCRIITVDAFKYFNLES